MPGKVLARYELIQQYKPAHFQKGEFLNVKFISQPVFSISLSSLESGRYPSYGEYTSPVLKTDFPFKEVIFSWNSNTPPGAGLVFFLRTKTQFGIWSDWFNLANWGDVEFPIAKTEKKNLFGKLDVDTLILKEPASEIQYRICFFTQDESKTPVIKMTTICYGSEELSSESTIGKFNGAAKAIPVPYLSQKEGGSLSSYVCGPTSLAMILGYYGIKESVLRVSEGCYDKRNDLYGNWPFIVAYGSERGLYGWVSKFDSLDKIRVEISQGFPVIVGLAYETEQLTRSPIPGGATTGHLLVICGFDKNGDVITCDPAGRSEATGRITYSKDEFEKVWLNSGGVALLFRPPNWGRSSASLGY